MKVMLAVYQLGTRGGKERDCVAIARYLARRGHDVTILTTSANLPGLGDLRIATVPNTGFANYARARGFADAVLARKLRERPDALLAFERIPGADFFYAADSAVILQPPRLLSWPPRRWTRLALERGVFSALSQTHVFFVTARQRDEYAAAYGFDPSRATVLPLILHDDRFDALRGGPTSRLREVLGISQDALLAVSIAVNPKLKGVDRTLDALQQFPQLHLAIVGSKPRWLRRLVERLKLTDRVHIVPYFSDIMKVISASDFMIHPARSEAAGLVIGEALLAGVPAVISGLCGYSPEVERFGAGIVLPEPFRREDLVAGIAAVIGSLPAMRQAAADQSLCLQQQQGSWLAAIAERIEQGA